MKYRIRSSVPGNGSSPPLLLKALNESVSRFNGALVGHKARRHEWEEHNGAIHCQEMRQGLGKDAAHI